MSLLKSIRNTITEALFPLSPAEKELLSLSPEKALTTLTPAPDFFGLAIPTSDARFMNSIFAYKDKRVEKLVWSIKYKKSAHAVEIGGYALYQVLSRNQQGQDQQGEALLVPMPITARRRRERGYNQCELLIDEIKKLDTEKKFLFESNLLIRVQHEDRQTLKGRSDRIESAKGIFGVNKEILERIDQENIKNYSVIIIDDVITTGSTMKEAIDTMKAAGFEDVRGLSVAH